ncbi:MAG: uracil DNA glycosylase [Peltula sp. TS41687]|nr:MAG: uracil DNA glycosylase [Peltula sp. TS41687]
MAAPLAMTTAMDGTKTNSSNVSSIGFRNGPLVDVHSFPSGTFRDRGHRRHRSSGAGGMGGSETCPDAFSEGHVNLITATSDALRRLEEEENLPVALVDYRSRVSQRLVRERIKQLALSSDHWPVPSPRPGPVTLRQPPRRPENQPTPTREPENQPTRSPQPAPKSVQEAIQKLALSDKTIRDSYSTVPAGLAEGSLCQLDITLCPRGCEEHRDNIQKIGSINAYVDTGAHVTIISSDLLSEDYWKFLQTADENEPYRNTVGGTGQRIFCQVDFIIEIPQLDHFTFNVLALVVPRSAMPNQLSGVLLGQRSFLERMEFSFRPWRITKAVESESGGSFDDLKERPQNHGWGTVEIKRFVDLEGNLHQFG